MINNLQNWIEEFEYSKEQIHENLILLPVITSKPYDFDFLTLKRAFKEETVEVRELDLGGSVPEVMVINKSDKYLVIFDGEHLIGAKQNRVVNHTIVISPLSELVIPVSCTEQGRWYDVSEGFVKSRYNAPNSIRRASKKKSDSQSEVWENVASVMYCMRVDSPTSSLNEVFEQVSSGFRDYRENIKLVPSQIGFIVFINGRLSGVDIVCDPKVFSDLYESLINSYILEAKSKYNGYVIEVIPEYLRKSLLEELAKLKLTRGRKIGVEKRRGIKGEKIVGELVSFNGKPIHIAIFENSNFSNSWEN